MPELPEVETVRAALEPPMTGRTIARAQQRRPDLRWPFPERFVARLEGQRVTAVRRRAKYLLIDLDSGETLIVHLGMSGRVTVLPTGGGIESTASFHHAVPTDARTGMAHATDDTLDVHDHAVFDLDDGTRIIYNDHRRFGMMDLVTTSDLEASKHFMRMGPEPLGNAFHAAHLDAALAGKATPIKAALLDQRVVAGLGNIYVCEALYHSRISPRRLARSVCGVRVARLVPAIRDVLNAAIAAGGSTLRDYAHTDGSLGYFQHTFAVYDREGAPCPRDGCQGTIKRIVQSGRSSFYCGNCQR
ncbi:MAG: bifunctional DNA-formamidopyrimidine glycosylase/DNA-(apurinic or apyrimidinic site) lyase [Pseudomonadota bacterium]